MSNPVCDKATENTSPALETSDSKGMAPSRPTVKELIRRATVEAEVKRRHGLRSPSEMVKHVKELGRGVDLVAGLLPVACLAMLVGDSGLGKSPLLYLLALCVAMGLRFLGFAVRQGRVLFIDFENGLAQVTDLLQDLASHLELDLDQLRNRLLLWNYHDAPADGNEATIQAAIRDMKPALVIIDSLNSYCPDVEERTSNAVRALKGLRAMVKESGATILVVHHIRKKSAKPDERPKPLESANLRQWFQQVRGAGALVNSIDVRIGMDDSLHIGAAVVLRGFARLRGEIPAMHLARVKDDDGEPLGYQRLTGKGMLSTEQVNAFDALAERFRFKDAKVVYGKADQATTDFLKKCIGLGILTKPGRAYEKTPEGGI